jgi:hypothetical protein
LDVGKWYFSLVLRSNQTILTNKQAQQISASVAKEINSELEHLQKHLTSTYRSGVEKGQRDESSKHESLTTYLQRYQLFDEKLAPYNLSAQIFELANFFAAED